MGVRLSTTGRSSTPYSRIFVDSSRLASSAASRQLRPMSASEATRIAISRVSPPCHTTPGDAAECDGHPVAVRLIVGVDVDLVADELELGVDAAFGQPGGRAAISSVFQRGANFPV